MCFDIDAGRDIGSGSGCGSVVEVPCHFGVEIWVVVGVCVGDGGGWCLHSFYDLSHLVVVVVVKKCSLFLSSLYFPLTF